VRKREFLIVPHSKFRIRSIFIFPPFAFILSACLFLLIPASLSAVGELKVGVLELRNEADITSQEAAYLTDKVRDAASRALASRGFLVITRESLKELLPPGTDLAKCTTASCEVDVGRKIGVDYIVTGEILKFSGEFRANLKAHHSATGAFLGAEACKGKSLIGLENSIARSSQLLFNKVLRHAGVGSALPKKPMIQPGAIGETSSGQWSMPMQSQVVVRFESNPPGAVVLVDGKLKCQQTPCSKTLATGAVNVSMQSERYHPKQEIVQIQKDMPPLIWMLSPNFGWLSVKSIPPGLSMKINGEAAGTTPLAIKVLDPGDYEVLVTDPRYYDKGERFSLSAGEHKMLSVTLPQREGGMQVSAVDQQGNDLSGEVYLDGKKVGSAPGSFKVIIGSHSIEVKTPQGSWSGSVEIKEKQVASVVAQVKTAARATTPASPASSGGGLAAGGEVWVDSSSGLTWQVSPTGGKKKWKAEKKWKAAKAHCSRLNLGGYSDWRLPTITELRSLIRGCPATQKGGSCGVTDSCLKRNCWKDPCKGCSGKGGPGQGGAYWPPELSGAVSWYWSSSAVADDNRAWYVHFRNGDFNHVSHDYTFGARCVR
jgi:TolB-like protein